MKTSWAGASLPAAAGTYLTWGPIQISVTNLVVVAVMVAAFVAALLVPFGPDRGDRR